MIIIEWLRWLFGLSGIVAVEESGKLSWLQAIKRLFSGGVARKPNGPTNQDFAGYARMRLDVKRYKCKVCGTHFWSWKKRSICYKWFCCEKRNA